MPTIYKKFRLKGIVIFTDIRGIKINQKWVKDYPRIIDITANFKNTIDLVHRMVHNTLFKGACKFKDVIIK